MGSNGDTLKGSIGLLVLRVGVSGLLLFGHGLSKVTRLAELSKVFPDPLHVGSAMSLGMTVFAEVLCTLFVALGLFTRFAVMPLIVMFLVLVFIHHASDPWKQKELAMVFLVPFVALFFTGPGKFALDSWISLRVGGKH